MPRDELAEALWGETPPSTWDKALTGIVSKLRGLLAEQGIDGANALTGAFGCYRLELPEGSWVDVLAAAAAVDEAEAALAAGELDGAKEAAALAASLLRQEFLPGEEGSWVEQKRRELAELRGRAFGALAEASLRSGDAPEAVKWAEQTIALAPFRETGYRRLMEAHVAAGDRAEALARLRALPTAPRGRARGLPVARDRVDLPGAPRSTAGRQSSSARIRATA